jgi:RimJ/RimL family protein N-acetyltransferase
MNANRQPTRSATTATAPELKVGDLRLVPFTDSDAADLVAALRGDEDTARFSSLRRVHDLATALQWMASRRREGQLDWAIRDADDRLVGRTALRGVDLDLGVGEIGYTVFAPYRRQGIATRVADTVTRYGFEQLGLTRVELRHAVANQASCRVARRSGFALEGELRSGLPHPAGGLEDSHLHARLRDDPPGPLSTPTSVAATEVSGDGLRLRPWREDDAPFLLAAMDDPGVSRWSPLRVDGRPLASLADARQFALQLADWSGGPRGQHCSWLACDAADGTRLGHVSLFHIDQVMSSAGIGYWVAPAARGRGVAARAVTLAAGWAYPTLGLRRIELFHAVENPGSCAVARAAGFTLEGTMRATYRYGDGELHDEHAHARLCDDPPGPTREPPPPVHVELVAEGLRLVPWHDDLAPFVLAAAEDPELVSWNPLRLPTRMVRTLEDATEWVRWRGTWSVGEAAWAVCELDGTPLGHVALHHMDRADQLVGELGFWTSPEARGRGVASRAVRTAARWGFEELGLHRIEIFHAVVNPGSCRVAEACGFAFEGVQRQGFRYPEGEFHDEHRHARLADD